MRVLLCVSILFTATFCLDLEHHQKFNQFKSKFSKVYKNAEEENLRYSIFLKNVAEAEAHNMAGSTYTRGINEWSDLTQAEWEDIYLGGYKQIGAHTRQEKKNPGKAIKDLPASIDWREKGAITAVKNQGQCGSCWAFGTTEQIEAYAFIASGELVELSAQQVTSCTPNPLSCGGTGGCQGSTPALGYNYIQLFGQVPEADYPYVSGTSTESEDCMYDLSNLTPVVSVTGYDILPANDQEAVMNHIATVGPLAISVAANTFKDYHGGVFSGCDYDENIQLNHSVQLVGYGTDYSPRGVVDYWLVRNSWGTNWGEDGYIRILREANPRCGTDTKTSGHVCQGGPGMDELHVCGMCGMLFETSYPLGAQKL